MKKLLSVFFLIMLLANVNAQPLEPMKAPDDNFVIEKINPATIVKNQAMSGTCWCFSTTSLVESQCLKNAPNIDLSEMYTVRNIYIEKARNYVLRQGHAQFGEGGLGHDLIRAIATYGAVPEAAYSGLKDGAKAHNHVKLSGDLKKYLDSILKISPLPATWLTDYTKILNNNLGVPPESFDYNGKTYTAKSFASEVLKFNNTDYVNITSFTHHPFYAPFILEVPDNFSNGNYYNIPLREMISVVKHALEKGYTVMWDADVSNSGFRQGAGLALFLDPLKKYEKEEVNATTTEMPYNETERQRLFENLTTQDDHLMHITGIEKTKEGKEFFIVKNSWGEVGPYKGYINVSEAYFAINTVSLVVPKAAIDNEMLGKLGIK